MIDHIALVSVCVVFALMLIGIMGVLS